MPNRTLSEDELAAANKLLSTIRSRLLKLSSRDESLFWALRRKVYKELTYDERGKPMQRRRLKQLKRTEQKGCCARCREPLPEKYVVLDRLEAMGGYTVENTRLLCRPCDEEVQLSRGFK